MTDQALLIIGVILLVTWSVRYLRSRDDREEPWLFGELEERRR